MGGFRPGCLGKVRYRDIVMSVIQDLQDPMKKKYAATIMVRTNKVKESVSAKVMVGGLAMESIK
jgi:N-acetylmuramoyl-L-alanine amidase